MRMMRGRARLPPLSEAATRRAAWLSLPRDTSSLRRRFRLDRTAALTPGCCLLDAASVSLDAPFQGPVRDSHWLLQRRVDSAI
jgi:hypothetical protein